MDAKAYIGGLIDKARIAQKEYATYNQEQVDAAVRAIGKAIYDRGEELARMAVDETKMGCYEDKIMKNKGKAMAVWNYLKGKKSVGILRRLEDENMVEIAKPMGVVGAIAPVTNPVMTPMHNAMIALKAGNAIIIAPHPSGRNTGMETAKEMRKALKAIGAPEDLIQCVEPEMVSVETSGALMSMADVCVATGGPGMVKAAYSSGKPAYGVGAGNMQCIVDTDVDPEVVAPKIIRGRTYDNGVLCTCEQNFICHESMFDALVKALEKNGAYYVADQKLVDDLRETLYPAGALNKKAVGLSAVTIAKMAGFEVPEGTKALIAKANGAGTADVYGKEKLFPIIAAYTYKTWEEGVGIALANLEMEGAGHSSTVHSNNKEHVEYAGLTLPVSRLLVNGVGSSGVGGAYSNSFVPTATLGCGSWGNNSISENLNYVHLMNVSRIGYTDESKPAPTPEEVWG